MQSHWPQDYEQIPTIKAALAATYPEVGREKNGLHKM